MNRRHQGFTLIELVMVIFIIATISVVLSQIMQQSFKTFITSHSNSELDWQGFLALENFANDVQSIRSPNDMTTITPTQFAFINHDGVSVTYLSSSGTLTRNSVPLAIGVNNITFSYYDKNYLTTTSPSLVRYISINLGLSQQNLNLSFSTMAATRGLS